MNAQGSGAAGVGQVMPETARALAARIGLPYRPELLRGTSEEAKRYQDAITNAAVREAWDVGGAGKDPRTAAQYYFGGSDRDKWGPKTQRYGGDILERLRALRGN